MQDSAPVLLCACNLCHANVWLVYSVVFPYGAVSMLCNIVFLLYFIVVFQYYISIFYFFHYLKCIVWRFELYYSTILILFVALIRIYRIAFLCTVLICIALCGYISI